LSLIFSLLLLFANAGFAKEPLRMAITVDDLPSHGDLPPKVTRLDIATKMLSVLKMHKVPEVYGFINAQRIDGDPDRVKVLEKWRAEGYPLGNHTYSHADLNKMTTDEFTAEISKNEDTLIKLNGKADWLYFRYPYLYEGNEIQKRDAIRKFLFDNHYQIAQVSADFEDWSWNNPYARCREKNDEKAISWLKKSYLRDAIDTLKQEMKVSKVVFKKQMSHILLLHIGAFDAEMLDQLLKKLEAMGVEFIPLSQALKDEVYQIDPHYVAAYGTEFEYQVLKSKHLTAKSLGIVPKWHYTQKKLDAICR
jgi:peptidoglycan-N-acetylglucosamine deacetylase